MSDRVELPPPQVMAVKLDGHYFQLWDLPIEDVEAVAANHGGVFWLSVITSPLSSLSLARDVVEAVAKRMGKAVPLMTSAREVWNLFEQIPEDMPAEFADGIPKEVPDATETTGS